MKRMLKRVLALTLCMVMILGCVTTASAAEGEDTPAGNTLTAIGDVKAFGEIVTKVRVEFTEPFEGSLDDAQVIVTYMATPEGSEEAVETTYEREVINSSLSEDKLEATFDLVEGGFAMDPWNTKDFVRYEVKIGEISIVGTDFESPDVDKFEEKTYTTPEYTWNKGNTTMTTMSARAYSPDKEVYVKPEAGYPLVVWLHGGGETGDDNRIQIAANNVPQWSEEESQGIFGGAYVLAPQNHAGAGDGAAAATKSLIEQFVAEMGDIDINRIYVGGCSYGGSATWTMIRNYPNFFAAAYPICSGPSGGLSQKELKALANLPIYITVSTGDSSGIVSGMIQAYNDLKAAGNENVHISLFEHSECEGQAEWIATNNRYIDHWSWVYVHDNYDAKGDDFDGKHFIDTTVDGEYNEGAVVVKDGVLTYTYTSGEEQKSISLDGKNERPEDAGYPTIKEWIADQVNEPADTLTIIRDVKAFGEIVDGLQVDFVEPFEGSLEGAKVTVTVADKDGVEQEYPRTVVNATLADDKMSATLELEEGGFSTDPWNSVGYLGYKVEIGDKVITQIAGDISPDVDQFNAVTYTTPEYEFRGEPKTTMDARYFVPDKAVYTKPEAGYPLVIWQHGGGEQGTDNRIQIAANDVPAWAEKDSQDIFGGAYILAPQNHAGASVEATMSLIEQFVAEMGDIDPNRIYIGGCSYGGSATWAMIRTYPEYFAAAYPICRGPVPVLTDEEVKSLVDLPIYITVAAGDNADRVYGLIEAYNQLKAASNQNVHITLFDHSEFEGLEGFTEANSVGALDHWSWVYVHDNYDAKGDDFDGKNFIDSSVDKVYEYNTGLTGVEGKISTKLTVQDGVITYAYTVDGTETTITLDGKNERPEDAGCETIKEWIAAQNLQNSSAGTLTVVRDVKDFGEIVTELRVVADEPIADDLDSVQVFVTVNGERMEREVEDVLLAENGGNEAVIKLVEGGFNTDPWNSVNYQAYEVKIGDLTINKVVDDISPDVDKFEAVTYTVPEYQYSGEPKTTMDARYFVPDKAVYEKPEAGYPLVIWLHGGGETGTDNRIHLAANNVPAWTEKESQDIFNGAYVLAPQNHASAGTGAAAATKSLIDQFIKEMGDIDTDRIYIGGCSYGGMGTWQMLRNYPDFFAAAYPICGAVSGEGAMGALTDEEIKSLANLPIYMTVSSGDTIFRFPYGMIETYNRLKAAGNKNLHIAMFEHSEFEGQDGFVELKGVGALDHWSWVYVHNNYDAKGDDYDGRNFLDFSKDATYNDGRTTIKDGVLTYSYTSGDDTFTIALDGKNERPEDTGYETIKEWIAAQNKGNEPPKKDFTDVPADAWYANAVEYVVAQGIMVGTNDGTTFEPDTKTTRAMVAQMLYQLEGKPAASDPTFSDVPAGEWFSNAIAWAAENKVVNGYENNKFGPYDTVTREQLAMMLYKYASFKGLDLTGAADLTAFPDAGSVSDWAEKAVKWAVSEKLINGKTNDGVTYLDPQGLASRAEVAQIFMKFCQK